MAKGKPRGKRLIGGGEMTKEQWENRAGVFFDEAALERAKELLLAAREALGVYREALNEEQQDIFQDRIDKLDLLIVLLETPFKKKRRNVMLEIKRSLMSASEGLEEYAGTLRGRKKERIEGHADQVDTILNDLLDFWGV